VPLLRQNIKGVLRIRTAAGYTVNYVGRNYAELCRLLASEKKISHDIGGLLAGFVGEYLCGRDISVGLVCTVHSGDGNFARHIKAQLRQLYHNSRCHCIVCTHNSSAVKISVLVHLFHLLNCRGAPQIAVIYS